MQCNVGKGDKIFRIILGLIIGAVGLYFQSWWGLLGLIPLLTALMNFCPLYSICKIKTNKSEE